MGCVQGRCASCDRPNFQPHAADIITGSSGLAIMAPTGVFDTMRKCNSHGRVANSKRKTKKKKKVDLHYAAVPGLARCKTS